MSGQSSSCSFRELVKCRKPSSLFLKKDLLGTPEQCGIVSLPKVGPGTPPVSHGVLKIGAPAEKGGVARQSSAGW